jgi:hypothetical protein
VVRVALALCVVLLVGCGKRYSEEPSGEPDHALEDRVERGAGGSLGLMESNSPPGAPRHRFPGDEADAPGDRPSGPWSAGDERCETPNSSFIDEACYDADEEQLTLVLNGRSYTYCGVDEDLFEELVEAASPGRVYNSRIKGRHRCF